MKSKKPSHTREANGFALVVTLTLMILLSILALGMLSLSAVSLRTSGATSAETTARANARMALMLAISELQKNAGPDQRISARADIFDSDSPNPSWTGAWSTEYDTTDPSAAPEPPTAANAKWLVSGESPDPATQLSDASPPSTTPLDSVVLYRPLASNATGKELRAPLVEVSNPLQKGSYAWWVGDEGVKARVDLEVPTTTGTTTERLVKSRSPMVSGLEAIGAEFDPVKFGSNGSIDKSLLVSMETLGHASGEKDVPKEYFDDVTTGGFGLPVNVALGGMKTDLSLVFDRSKQGEAFVTEALGAKPTGASMNNSKYYDFSVDDSSKFYLSKDIASNLSGGVGPNWGTLFNYGRLWESASSGKMGLLASNPKVESDLRQQHWLPYMRDSAGTGFQQDVQHTNSSVAPVVSLMQIGFYLGAKAGPPSPDGSPRYQVQLLIKPILGLWNPYNVSIKAVPYQLEWAIAPHFRIDFQPPNTADGSFPTGGKGFTEIWLRDYWKIGSTLPQSGNQGGSYMRLRTPSIDFQPGEFRLFSVEANPEISSNYNLLVPTLDPKGSFTVDILRSQNMPTQFGPGPDDKKGMPLLAYPGDWGWFGDVVLQDSHFSTTKTHFPNLDLKAASTWFTLKVNGGAQHLNRYANIWNGGKDTSASKPYNPEPILTARSRLNTSGQTGKQPRAVEELAAGNLSHVGTWRWYMRNSTEVDEPNQGLRGWVDSNPVTISSNMRLDGSTNTSSGIEGWNSVSHLIPGAHRTGAKAGDVGDGNGGNRGLVSEGSYGNPIPQGPTTAGRWQGYGGPGSTAASGFSHVIVYDVPRSPLVSVGQFQNAQLSRYNFEPGFVVGNSYANPRVPLDKEFQTDFAKTSDFAGFKMVDTAYQVNERLWDGYFFSTLGLDYLGQNSGSFDSAFDFQNLVLGSKTLPNPRMVFLPLSGDTSIDKVISDAGTLAPQAISARIGVSGAFNVNSTSVAAWKAFLSSMESSEFPTIDAASGSVSWQDGKGIRFNRFGHAISSIPTDAKAKEAAFWQGWRELNDDELQKLAESIVNEVKDRGPFLSFADFVNRDPNSDDIEHRQKGALQAAIDETLNDDLPTDIGNTAGNPVGNQFSDAITTENQTGGHGSYLLQGDVLQSLSPVMQVRSDYFRIRSYGEAKDEDGKVIARAWCEAFVQRSSQFVDPTEKPETATTDLNPVNLEFGRQFEITGFRWLSPDEI